MHYGHNWGARAPASQEGETSQTFATPRPTLGVKVWGQPLAGGNLRANLRSLVGRCFDVMRNSRLAYLVLHFQSELTAKSVGLVTNL